MADISHVLGNAKINIESIQVDVAAGKAVITMGLSDPDKGRKALIAAGYDVEETNEMVIILEDRPGELDKVAGLLSKGRINIEKMLTISNDGEKTMLSIKVDNPEKAAALLKEYLYEEGMTVIFSYR